MNTDTSDDIWFIHEFERVCLEDNGTSSANDEY